MGVQYGIEFTGGTYFQIKLEEKVTPVQMETITSIISQRIDAFGLKDTRVNAIGEDVVAAQIAETDPQRIAKIESLLKTQARFEAMLDGNILFTGSDIKAISRDSAFGYGVYEEQGGFRWSLPFTLSQIGAESFSRKVFHKCAATGFDSSNKVQYDCEDTYFFIDRPHDSIIIIPRNVMDSDEDLLASGNAEKNIPQGITFSEILSNSGLQYFTIDNNLTAAQLQEIKNLAGSAKKVIVHKTVGEKVKEELLALGFKVEELKNEDPAVPWIWNAVGVRQIISITPGIANLEPYVEDVKNAHIFSQLYITGASLTQDAALEELRSTTILLETGSLPIGIESVSKETISPLLGKEFLSTSILIGLAALVLVSIVLFIRYRRIRLTTPIVFIGLSELAITVGVSTLLGVRFDLSGVTGVIAAIGTGLNDQIVILDELLKGGGGEIVEASYANRIKKAFFIVIAAAATIIAALAPILLFASSGFGKLAGFAVTTIIGVLMGIFITRPAFSIIAEYLLKTGKK